MRIFFRKVRYFLRCEPPPLWFWNETGFGKVVLTVPGFKNIAIGVWGPLNGPAGCAKKDNGESCCLPDYQNNLI